MKNIIIYSLFSIFFWLLPSFIFSSFYESYSDNALDHLLLMLGVSVGLIGFHLSFQLFFTGKFKTSLAFFISFFWLPFVVISYIVMIVGLISWGRIPTVDVLRIYYSQIYELITVIGYSYIHIFIIFFVISILTFLFSFISFFLMRRVVLEKKSILFSMLFLVLSITFLTKLLLDKVILSSDNQEPWRQLFFKDLSSGTNMDILLSVIGSSTNPLEIEQEDSYSSSYYVDERKIKKNRSIVLITVDALRPDRMGVYGANRKTTPFLQNMKDLGRAHVIKEARSACSESTCGLLSFLSGKEPQQLLPKNFGLPEILGKLGYKRYFILSGDHSNYYGLRESYGKYDYYWDGSFDEKYANDDFSLINNIELLPHASSNDSYFFFIHLMSVHGLGKRYSRFDKWMPQSSIYKLSSDLEKNSDLHKNYYDNGVLQADFILESIYAILKRKNYIDESSIVLVTADHGDGLGDNGVRTHAESLYESVIRIPWIWLGSHPIGGLNQPVVQADFAPTVLKEINAPIPEHWSGIALQEKEKQRKFSFHIQLPFAAVISYEKDSRKKLILDIKKNSYFFFDLCKDPHEKNKIIEVDIGLKNILGDKALRFIR